MYYKYFTLTFKHKKLQVEFTKCHPKIRAMIYEIYDYCALKGYQTPVVNHLERDWKTHVAIYGKEKAKEVKSPHLDRPCRGADISVWQWLEEEMKDVEVYINNVFEDPNYKYPKALIHNVGKGLHMHLQCGR